MTSTTINAISLKKALRHPNWQLLILMMTVQAFFVGICMYSFTLWIGPWMEAFNASRRDALLSISLTTYSMGIMSFLVGRWIDHTPSRIIVILGLVCLASGLCLIALAPSMWVIWFIHATVLPAGGAMCGPLVAMTVVTRNFHERRGLAVALVTLGTSLGGVVFPFIVVALLEVVGWRSAFLLLGVASAVLLVPAAWIALATDFIPEQSKKKTTDGDARTSHILARRVFWALVCVYLTAWFVFTSVQHNIQPYAADLGISTASAAGLVSVLAIAMIGGKVLVGLLLDRHDPRFLFLGTAVFMFTGITALSISIGYLSAVASLVFLGLAAGALLPLQGTLYGGTFGTHMMGKAMGMAAPFQSFAALGPVFAGWTRDVTGEYSQFFQLCGAFFLLIALLVMLLPAQSRSTQRK